MAQEHQDPCMGLLDAIQRSAQRRSTIEALLGAQEGPPAVVENLYDRT